ncbi:MAG: hypothetical protein PGN13_05360 [Patulibacter minatonensis]
MRSLTAAWRARSVIGLPDEDQARIGQVLVELAGSPFYTFPRAALNQINWHAEVYAAALEVAGDKSVLDDYRAQLQWFAQYAHKADEKRFPGGSPLLTSGGGFRYLPNRARNAQLNQTETTEYGNLALGSLGFYQAFVRAGMPRLSAADEKVLREWSRHMLLGSWTQAGYPNWDTGLGTKRRHLRQYWAWSLDGLMTASGPDALLGYPKQRQYARSIAEHGIALYLATAWSPDMGLVDGPLPAKTSFDAPNGFTSGSGNELIGPLRFALPRREPGRPLPGRPVDRAAELVRARPGDRALRAEHERLQLGRRADPRRAGAGRARAGPPLRRADARPVTGLGRPRPGEPWALRGAGRRRQDRLRARHPDPPDHVGRAALGPRAPTRRSPSGAR